MRAWARWLLPPAAAIALLLALGLYTFWSEMHVPAHIIQGRPDNAPRRAAALIVLLAPLIYLSLLAFHSLCIGLHRWLHASVAWFYLAAIVLAASGLVLSSLQQVPREPLLSAIFFGLLMPVGTFLPMLLCYLVVELFIVDSPKA